MTREIMQKLKSFLITNPYWQQCKSWYEASSPKEQRAIQLLAAFLILVLGYMALWEPVTHWSQLQKKEYLYQEEVNEWLHGYLPKARELQKKKQLTADYRDLSSLASSTAQQAEIILGRVQPDRKGLSVWIEDTAYQKLLKWLVLLQTKHDIFVQQIRIDRLKEEGRVKSYLHLRG